MYTTEILEKNHKNIMRMTAVVKKMCVGIIEGKEVDVEDFVAFCDFASSYGDQYHHMKEENFLFPEMIAKLKGHAEMMIEKGMLVDHNLGRAHIMSLRNALNDYQKEPTSYNKLLILTQAMGYVDVLESHILKENNVLFPYANKDLPESSQTMLDEMTKSFEKRMEDQGVIKKYLYILEKLENKYQ
ncbi:hemerythrin domain-containing protein [Sharpea porci]|uniref:hemerythrin domain-containing protein n=1 Tax=Sharpea porci TaxID=2652286 RepID=UPI0024095A64|nr:hemerythrin domain-containing protein [Sharpea porci]MDD6711067.1 hemerythrin domain-containing protein [Sharpea porci]MDY5279616.1 hemerythrin domain-containing protein [Sharpea porci]